MATIGHTLTGLSLGGFGSPGIRGKTMPHLWPALIVLLAHAVDLVEWGAAIVLGTSGDSHFLTHSPLSTGILVLLIWIVLAFAAKVRSPLIFGIVAAAVFSHLLLDMSSVRFFVAQAYADRDAYDLPQFEQALVAEIWIFGLLFVLVSLGRAVLQQSCPRRGRVAGYVLGIAVVAAATTRLPAVWVPAYAVSLAHAAVLLRRRFHPRQLWGVVLLLPVLVFMLVEATAAHLTATGVNLVRAGRDREAIKVHERVLALPTRESRSWNHALIGESYERLGEPALAEAAFAAALRDSEASAWATIFLARFYMRQRWRDTPFFRPSKAGSLLDQAARMPHNPRVSALATKLRADLKTRGWTD